MGVTSGFEFQTPSSDCCGNILVSFFITASLVELISWTQVPNKANNDWTNNDILLYKNYCHYGALGAAVLASGYEYLKCCLDTTVYDS